MVVRCLVRRLIIAYVSRLLAKRVGCFGLFTLRGAATHSCVHIDRQQLVLDPVNRKLQTELNDATTVRRRLRAILSSVHQRKKTTLNCTMNGLVGLRQILKLSLANCSFSNLAIHRTSLHPLSLRKIGFDHTSLERSIFRRAFGCILSTSLDPSNRALTVNSNAKRIQL